MTLVGTRLLLSVGPEPVAVDVRVPEAVEAVRALFPEASPGSESGAPDLVLARDASDLWLRAAGESWRAPDVATILVRLELAVAEASVRRSGLLALHAGGVSLPAGALLVAGASGAGKSSLTAGLASRGLPALGDDAVLLAAEGTVHPLRRRLKVEEPARTLLGLPAVAGPLATLWPHACFYDPADLGSRWAEPGPVAAVVLPERLGRGDVEIAPITAAEALHALLGHVLLRASVSGDDFAVAARALAHARCFRLRYAECAAAVEALATLG